MISLVIICNDKKEYLHLLQDSLAQGDGVLSEVILVTSESQESVPFPLAGKTGKRLSFRGKFACNVQSGNEASTGRVCAVLQG